MNFNTIRPSIFDFEIVGNSCGILENAIDRYKAIIQNQLRRVRHHHRDGDIKWNKNTPEYQGHLVRNICFFSLFKILIHSQIIRTN
jgi:hypothetical protein